MQTLIDNLLGVREWGYRDPTDGSFVEDNAPFRAGELLLKLEPPAASAADVLDGIATTKPDDLCRQASAHAEVLRSVEGNSASAEYITALCNRVGALTGWKPNIAPPPTLPDLEGVKEALRPFANFADLFDETKTDGHSLHTLYGPRSLILADARRARAALQALEAKDV